MRFTRISTVSVFIISALFFLLACKQVNNDNALSSGRLPVIEPDYSGITIPPNIAPLNFKILEEGESFQINGSSPDGTTIAVNSSDGIVSFPLKSWKKLLKGAIGGKIEITIVANNDTEKATAFDPISIKVASEPVDPWLCYRLLYPGYKYWAEMKIVQRSTENFNEASLFENQLLEDNCVNCHSFKQKDPGRFLLHVRGSLGGTYFVNGDKVTRAALKTVNMLVNAVYPSWHPTGRYVAFSSNKTVQTFHMRPEKNIEVFDLFSSLVIYDVEKNEMFACPEKDTAEYMETFPCWSPDGEYLYYCRTPQVKQGYEYSQVHYDLVRKFFNPVTGVFGEAEQVYYASEINKSVSFPAISPDGQYLVFTLHDYGTFSIWHREADLYLLDLKSGKAEPMNLNSNESESYHSWSSNGRWLIFSSKRGDGLTARPYFAYFGSDGIVGKPFVLPQKDPTLYERMAKTFNRPEFVSGKIRTGPREFERASHTEPLRAIWTEK